MRIQDFIKTERLDVTAKLMREPVTKKANNNEWEKSAYVWHVELRRLNDLSHAGVGNGELLYTLTYHTGSGLVTKVGPDWAQRVIPKKPTTADILDCLGSDAAGYLDTRYFEDWASEYGYDPDSREAQRIYEAVGDQTRKLQRAIGPNALQTLAFEVERL